MEKKKVIKKDGSLESFQPEKITRVVTAAGLTDNEALLLTQHVSSWILGQEKDSFSTTEIRNEVIAELKKIKPYSAGLFEWYEKTKDNN